MPEEITATAPETAPAEVIAAAAAPPEPQQESTEFQVERFTVAATFAPPRSLASRALSLLAKSSTARRDRVIRRHTVSRRPCIARISFS